MKSKVLQEEIYSYSFLIIDNVSKERELVKCRFYWRSYKHNSLLASLGYVYHTRLIDDTDNKDWEKPCYTLIVYEAPC